MSALASILIGLVFLVAFYLFILVLAALVEIGPDWDIRAVFKESIKFFLGSLAVCTTVFLLLAGVLWLGNLIFTTLG